MPSETRIVAINTEIRDALLKNALIFRKFGLLMNDQDLRNLAYQHANEFEAYINEIWDCGFTVEELDRRFEAYERNLTERDS